MPIANRTRVSNSDTLSEYLRPYAFHGLDLDVGTGHALAECPFCGGAGKFSIAVDTGLWRCWSCQAGTAAGGGNALIFTRLYYEKAAAANVAAAMAHSAGVAEDRRLLRPDTAAAWGCVPAPDGTWLLPGYYPDGRLDQVYRRVRQLDKGAWVWRLLPTPNIWPEGKRHALHLPAGHDPARPEVWVCEGPWDGMALWELVRDDSNISVIAVPGCSVWRDEWSEMCRGKAVTLLYDSDHPRKLTPNHSARAGYDGMARVAKRLSGIAAAVRYLHWGPDGYDPERKSGWDVRDHLTQPTDGTDTLDARRANLEDLMSKVEDAPREWFNRATPMVVSPLRGSTESLPCATWAECEEAWDGARGGAMAWRRELSDALAVLLAVCASTQQAGNQLFVDLIGSPGSAKTTLCRGLLVSDHCVHVENMTKLISGWRKPGDGDRDCSFLARANGKTWVTCEFDTLGTSPQYHELMGKVRRIFDGETTAVYGNHDEDRVYRALRTPWIRAGTPKMVDHDQSQLGDRFMRYVINDPSEADKRAIARMALRSELSAVREVANCTAGSIVDATTRRAHALTGGYVDWLRAHVEEELARVDVPVAAEDYCIDLAELSADMRARPHRNRRDQDDIESHEFKEMPTRLARQNVRLACCLAVVFNKRAVDEDVLRVVRKVALDTASGHSLYVVHCLCGPNPRADGEPYQESGGLRTGMLQQWTGMTDDRLKRYLEFLRKIDVVEYREVGNHGAWFLTDRTYDLYLRVKGGM